MRLQWTSWLSGTRAPQRGRSTRSAARRKSCSGSLECGRDTRWPRLAQECSGIAWHGCSAQVLVTMPVLRCVGGGPQQPAVLMCDGAQSAPVTVRLSGESPSVGAPAALVQNLAIAVAGSMFATARYLAWSTEMTVMLGRTLLFVHEMSNSFPAGDKMPSISARRAARRASMLRSVACVNLARAARETAACAWSAQALSRR